VVEYYLRPGDLIITEKTYGILLKKTSTQWKYASRPHVHPTPEWYMNVIRSEDLYYHLDKKTAKATVIYAPCKYRRKRKKTD
jgi:hypothetical protein